MPANATYEQAGAVGVAAVTALQGLRDKGGLQAGQRVLINGAAGGVGTFAVQIARAMGAEVTGVCSTANVELVRSLGAGHVVDYTREDFTLGGGRYDVLLDNAGNRSWRDCKRVLAERGVLVTVGAPKDGKVLGGMGNRLGVRLASTGSGQRVAMFIAKMNRDDLEALRDLIEAGKVTPVIDRTYELSEVAQAFDQLATRHARAKIVVRI
jgi:NADPH:quinone reductase-like Zn-dependent oxidoreductase